MGRADRRGAGPLRPRRLSPAKTGIAGLHNNLDRCGFKGGLLGCRPSKTAESPGPVPGSGGTGCRGEPRRIAGRSSFSASPSANPVSTRKRNRCRRQSPAPSGSEYERAPARPRRTVTITGRPTGRPRVAPTASCGPPRAPTRCSKRAPASLAGRRPRMVEVNRRRPARSAPRAPRPATRPHRHVGTADGRRARAGHGDVGARRRLSRAEAGAESAAH